MVTSSASTTRYSVFDGIGNALASSQTTAGTPYNFQYTYNQSSQIKSMTLPSGRLVNNGYDGSGNVTQVGGRQRSFNYDAENRKVTATIGGQQTNYVYDGDGKRVQKVTPSYVQKGA